MLRVLTCVILLALPTMAQAQLASFCRQGSLQVTGVVRSSPPNNAPGTDYFVVMMYSGQGSLSVTITYRGGLSDKRPYVTTLQRGVAQTVRVGRLLPGASRLADPQVAQDVTVSSC
jgi:hypothetical protein